MQCGLCWVAGHPFHLELSCENGYVWVMFMYLTCMVNEEMRLERVRLGQATACTAGAAAYMETALKNRCRMRALISPCSRLGMQYWECVLSWCGMHPLVVASCVWC